MKKLSAVVVLFLCSTQVFAMGKKNPSQPPVPSQPNLILPIATDRVVEIDSSKNEWTLLVDQRNFQAIPVIVPADGSVSFEGGVSTTDPNSGITVINGSSVGISVAGGYVISISGITDMDLGNGTLKQGQVIGYYQPTSEGIHFSISQGNAALCLSAFLAQPLLTELSSVKQGGDLSCKAQ